MLLFSLIFLDEGFSFLLQSKPAEYERQASSSPLSSDRLTTMASLSDEGALSIDSKGIYLLLLKLLPLMCLYIYI